MKKIFRGIGRAAAVLCVIALALAALRGVENVLEPAYIGDTYNAMDAFASLPENSNDVLVYGSSHAWKGFDSEKIWKDGIRIFNCGSNWQALNTTELFVKQSLKTQSPKVAVIETYRVGAVLQNTQMDGEIYYTNHLPWSKEKAAYLKQCFGNDYSQYLSYFFPVIPFHSNWSALTQWSFENPSDSRDLAASRGFYGSKAVRPAVISDWHTFEQKALPAASVRTLDSIVGALQKRHVKILFYTQPYQGEFNYHDALTDYATKHDCAYVDLFEHMDGLGLDGNADFADTSHLNEKGAAKVAAYLEPTIRELLSAE